MTMCPFKMDLYSFAIVCFKILKRDRYEVCKKYEIMEIIENVRDQNYLQIVINWLSLSKSIGT